MYVTFQLSSEVWTKGKLPHAKWRQDGAIWLHNPAR
jgi:hypothetical protein